MHQSVHDYVHRVIEVDVVLGRSVLEVGSFNVNGSVRPYVESLGAAKYLGVDKRTGPGVDLAVDCEELTATVGDDWDVVISTEMLEHVENWRECMIQLACAVKPGGRLLLTTRSPGFPRHGYDLPEEIDPRKIHDHWRYTVADMTAIMTALDLVAIVEEDPLEPGVFVFAFKPFSWLPDLPALHNIAVAGL